MSTLTLQRTNVLAWVAGILAVFVLLAGMFVFGFVVPLVIGGVGAVQACGFEILTGARSTSDEQPQVEFGPSPDATPSPTGEASPVQTDGPDPAKVGFGEAATAYFNQFSPAQQAEKKKIAALIVSIGKNRDEKFTRHDIEAAIGVAIQESNFHNYLVAEDHDSLGIYQQRPSVGSWGTAQQIIDPVHATNKFYDAMHAKIPAERRQQMSLMDIGIAVQIPNPAAYRMRWDRDNIDAIAKDIVGVFLGEGATTAGNLCMEAVGVSSGKWHKPLDEGSYCVLDGFGPRLHPIYKIWKQHSGLDLSCNGGNPVYAVHDGTIEVAGPSGDFGVFVVINHGDGTKSGYAHLRYGLPSGIVEGATVRAGQIVGYVGTTGGSTGEHLHFMAWIDEKLTDPLAFMQERGVTIQ